MVGGADRLWLRTGVEGRGRSWQAPGLDWGWMDGGAPKMGSLGVGTGLSAGHDEWPGGDSRLGLRKHVGDRLRWMIETTEMVELAVFERDCLPGVWLGIETVPEMERLGRGQRRTGSDLWCTLFSCLWPPNPLLGRVVTPHPFAPRALQPCRVGDDVRHVPHCGRRHRFHLRVPQPRRLQPQPGHGQA